MIAVLSASSAQPSQLEASSASCVPARASACVTGRPSACQGCLANCPVRVAASSDGEGKGIVIEGNALAGSTQGATCSNAALAIEQREDPDRLLYPLRRTNPRKGRHEPPCFERITWGEALSAIADRLMELRQCGQGHRVVFAKGRSTGINGLFMKALPDLYGTPNRLTHDGICAEAEKLATSCLDGVSDYHDYDFAHTRYVLMWGTDPLVGNRMKPRFARALGDLRKQAELVAVSPQRSLTAEKCHRWLAVRPGTDGALACALVHVILVEGLWNRAYVGDFRVRDAAGAGDEDAGNDKDTNKDKDKDNGNGGNPQGAFVAGTCIDEADFAEINTHGLATWWNEALKDATPAWAQARCGIPEDDIRAVARGFAQAGSRAVSWVSPGVTMCARGLYTGMACYALNGLVGSVGAEGGVLNFPRALAQNLPDTAPFQDEQARIACRMPTIDQRDSADAMAVKGNAIHANQVTNRVADAILEGAPYEIDTLIAYWMNWAYSCSGAQRWERALAKVPFFVHMTTHLSETSMFADIVLPARHHLFEDWGFVHSRQGGVHTVALEQPCVESPGECKGDETDFPYELAVALAERDFDAPLRYYRSITDPCTNASPQNGRELGEFAVKRMLEPLWNNGEDVFGLGGGARAGTGADGCREAAANVGDEADGDAHSDASVETDNDVAADAKAHRSQAAWEEFRRCGVWNSEPAVARKPGQPVAPLPTPTGRFEFESEKLRKLFASFAQASGIKPEEAALHLGYEARGERALVPHYEQLLRLGDPDAYPLVFTQHRSRLSLEGRSANTRSFQEGKGADPGDEPWDDVLKLHPADMAALGLVSGDEIEVSSVQGSIVCHAKEWDGTRPGVAVKCYGQGHWAYGCLAAKDFDRGIARGGNNNEIIPAVYERASGATARHGGLVRIRARKLVR